MNVFSKGLCIFAIDLRDFCGRYGRVTPHLSGSSDFTSFHCEDRSHDASETIHCSEGIGVCEASFVGVLSMRGYVATVVGGLSLGKTKHERPVQGSIPQPFNPVFPPQSTAAPDDLPF